MGVDALAAIGLAGNIVQFVDFSIKLFSQSREIYVSGAETTAANNDLEKITQSLKEFSDRFSNSSEPGNLSTAGISWEEQELYSVSQECRSTADFLLSTLQKLKRRGGNVKWSSFRQALGVMWKKSKIDQTVSRLNAFRDQLSLCLLQILRNDQSAVSAKIDQLSEACQQVGTQTTETLQDLKCKIIGVVSQLRGSDLSEEATARLARKLIHYLSALNRDGEKAAKEQGILESLCFRAMTVRHDQIPDPYRKTFEWIYDPIKTTFLKWLSSGDGIYWITGKAGSGKSTLMKFISDSSRTSAALQGWARDKRLIIASFYFWNPGTDMQKSLQGLLQSLLYEILRQLPDFMPVILPSRWQDKLKLSEPWTQNQLKQAFALLQQQTILSARFCFFIDGLDEYEGNHQETVQLLKNAAESHIIKICIASRPWNIFRDAFGTGHNQKLFMEDLTRNDIEIYVKSQLEGSPNFAQACRSDGDHQNLISGIVSKAEGVFLWATLAVQSLLDGLTNADTIEELYTRIDDLPPDLELLFLHMFDRTDKVYKQQAAKLFLMTLTALESGQKLPLAALPYIDEDVAQILHAPVKPVSGQEILTGLQRTGRRLNARCNGLLITPSTGLKIKWTIEHGFALNNSEKEIGLLDRVRVDFMHRSVRDFLCTEKMYDALKAQAGREFCPLNCICLAILRTIKSLRGLPKRTIPEGRADIYRFVDMLISYAEASEIHYNHPQSAALNELFHVLRFVQPVLLEQRWNAPSKEDEGCDHALRAVDEFFSTKFHRNNVLWYSYSGCVTLRNLTLYLEERINSGDPEYGADKHLFSWVLFQLNVARWTKLVYFNTASLLLDRYGADQLKNPALYLRAFDFLQLGQKDAFPWNTNPRTWSPKPTIWQAMVFSLRFVDIGSSGKGDSSLLHLFSTTIDNGMNPNEKLWGVTLWIEAITGYFVVSPRTTAALVQIFLEHGADPNQISTITLSRETRRADGEIPRKIKKYDPNTPWGIFLKTLYIYDWRFLDKGFWGPAIEQFLKAGADRSLVIYPDGPGYPGKSIPEVLEHVLPAAMASRLRLKYFQRSECEARPAKRIKINQT